MEKSTIYSLFFADSVIETLLFQVRYSLGGVTRIQKVFKILTTLSKIMTLCTVIHIANHPTTAVAIYAIYEYILNLIKSISINFTPNSPTTNITSVFNLYFVFGQLTMSMPVYPFIAKTAADTAN